MAVSQSASCSSIDLAGLPARILEALSGLVAVCREPLASAPCAAAFEEAELRVRESVNALSCEVLGAWVEGLDDGALRVERAGQCWFRVPATPKTIMSTLGPVKYSRARGLLLRCRSAGFRSRQGRRYGPFPPDRCSSGDPWSIAR